MSESESRCLFCRRPTADHEQFEIFPRMIVVECDEVPRDRVYLVSWSNPPVLV